MTAEISEITVYPIKSLSGVSVDAIDVEARGLRFDRRWMLVEADGTFITQRDDPSLIRFKVLLAEDHLLMAAPNMSSCIVPFVPSGPSMSVRVWKSTLDARAVSDDCDAWFSEALGRACHLVVMDDDSHRQISPDFGDHSVSFADAMPILVLSEASLADLNGRLENPVPFNRFRANIIVRGIDAYAEESFETLEFGNVRLRSTKRCGRCLVTCTDQETGERGTEPLRTLAAYHQFNNNACMGMYYVPETVGRIRVRRRG